MRHVLVGNQGGAAVRHVLVGNQSYGLYIGETDATDAEIVASGSVRLTNCRHVCRWFGRTGGITSLAAHGPCGKSANESRIGAPCSALVTGVVNVFDLAPEAIENFARIGGVVTDGDGFGDGSGDGDGFGSGAGYGFGDGSGDGDGSGAGYGFGDGSGDGDGFGEGA